MWNFYRDVTLYAAAVCVLFGLATVPARDSIINGVLVTIVVFGVFGTGLGILAFGYFQKQQYYMYHNLGFTKRHLITRTYLINGFLAIVLLIITSFFV